MSTVWLLLLAETIVVTGIAVALARWARCWQGPRRDRRQHGNQDTEGCSSGIGET